MTATPNTAALEALLARVEAGAISTDEIMDAFGNGWDDIRVLAAFDGSLDAAKELHQALLPDCNQYTIDEGPSGCGAKIVIWPTGLLGELEMLFDGYDVTPSRAWLGAILRALAAPTQPTRANEGET